MVLRGVSEFSGALAHFPTLSTRRIGCSHGKAVSIFLFIVAQPLQRLSLGTGHAARTFKRGYDRHACFHFSHNRNVPCLPDLTFGLPVDTAQIPDNNVWPPAKATPTIMKTGLEQITLRNMRRREPTHYGNQTNRCRVTVEPHAQRMLLIS